MWKNGSHILVSLIFLAGCGAGEDSSADNGDPVETDPPLPPLEWGLCDLSDWPDGYPEPVADLECTSVIVPVDWSDKDGPTLNLRVARHRSYSFPTGKAAFQLAGGPGGSSVVQSGMVPHFFPKLRGTFDLVYMDQRGTGGSGYLGCSAGYPSTKTELIVCANEHADKPLDHYMTQDAAKDLDFVRKRMGYKKIYIRGGSYGTRLALEYMKHFETNIAAVVLDGLAPPDYDYAGNVITQLDRGLDWLISECEASAKCKEVSPHLEQDLQDWRQSLVDAPRPILVGEFPYYEDEELLLSVLPAMLDWADVRYKIPRAIHQATEGNTTRWNYLLSQMFGVTITDAAGETWFKMPKPVVKLRLTRNRPEWRGQTYVAPGLHAAVSCAEWIPNSSLEEMLDLHEQQSWDDGHIFDFVEACDYWNVTPLSEDSRTLVTSTANALLTSGAIDIVTPPEQGEHALTTLPNGTHVVVPYATHSTMMVSCASDIMTEFFLADGDFTGIDTSCLADLRHPAW